MFPHEKFKAYQHSIRFLEMSLTLSKELPRGSAHIRDQLKRAATSIPLNIAEGSGKSERGEKARFYSIARGSAMECAAICDVIARIDAKQSKRIEEAKAVLESITKILVSVCSK